MERSKQCFADRFETREDLDNWILRFYEDRLAFFCRSLGRKTRYGTLITRKLIENTMSRYLELLNKKHSI